LQKKFFGAPRLLLDSGNFSDNPTPDGEVKTRGLIEGMSRMGYDVVNVGDRDLRMGYDEFRKWTEPASFPFVSANIVDRQTQKPVFDPYTVVEARAPDGSGSLQVGVIGVARFNPLFLKSGPEGSSLVIVKGEDVVGRYVSELRPRVDLIVLLAALHKEEAKRIVQAAPGIDFVVGSYGGMISAREEMEGSTRLLYAGNQGKRLGETRVYMDDQGRVQSAETFMHYLTSQYPSNQAMLDYVGKVSEQATVARQRAAQADQAASGSSR